MFYYRSNFAYIIKDCYEFLDLIKRVNIRAREIDGPVVKSTDFSSR